MRDNRTSQPAQEYDGNIRKTMPFYGHFHDTTLSLVEVAKPGPVSWLDTGCGTGTLVEKAAALFRGAVFTLADPSAAMLDIAEKKLSGIADCEYLPVGTEALECTDGTFDVITAILAHHYFDADTRRKATANCHRMLKAGGVYITFETVLPNTDKGKSIGLEWWRRAQFRQGKSEADVEKYTKRFGVEFFPIKLSDHLHLLSDAGFLTAEVFWVSGMQAGFYAIK